jgi:hypothetical protein
VSSRSAFFKFPKRGDGPDHSSKHADLRLLDLGQVSSELQEATLYAGNPSFGSKALSYSKE